MYSVPSRTLRAGTDYMGTIFYNLARRPYLIECLLYIEKHNRVLVVSVILSLGRLLFYGELGSCSIVVTNSEARLI